MLLRVLLCCAALLIIAGCKKDAKTEAGTDKAKEEAKAVTPADKGADKSAEKKNDLKVENVEVKPVPAVQGGKAAPAEEKRITGPVAIVNGKSVDSAVYYGEVDKILRRSSKIPPERMNRIKENILKRIIEKELIGQAVSAAKVEVPKAVIDKEFNTYKKRFRTDQQFENYLKHGRVTVESIQKRIREKKELELLLEKSGALKVSDEECNDFYKKNERFYEDRAGVRARHILVKLSDKAAPADKNKAMSKVRAVQDALKKGMKFADAAKKFSEGPSAPKGGDLGFFGKGQMVKPFEEKAFAMKKGEVSGPVQTRFGFHIIKVEEKREARKKPFSEVKSTIQESLRNKKFFQERRALLTKLKKEAKIERKIEIPKAPLPKASGLPAGHPPINPHGAVNAGRPSPASIKPKSAAPKSAAPKSAKPTPSGTK